MRPLAGQAIDKLLSTVIQNYWARAGQVIVPRTVIGMLRAKQSYT